MYPHNGVPGPAIGFLQESVRWWDHWLKGVDTGLQHEPPIHVWIPEAVEPRVSYTTRPGSWIEIDRWSDLDDDRLRLFLTPHGLDREPVDGSVVAEHGTPTTTASHPGAWCAAGREGDFPGDQRGEDGQSLSFTTQPLAEPMNIVGVPSLTARVAADQRQANLVVRLCDVAPDGTSTLITRGVLNLSHRDGHERPVTVAPGSFVDVRVTLGATGYAVPVGHRVRLALSGSLWPLVWPSPALPKLSFDLAGCFVDVPLHVGPDRPPVHRFAEPESAPPLQVEYVGEPRQDRRTEMRDIVTGLQTLTVPRGYPVVVRFVDADITYDDTGTDVFEIVGGDPLSATARSDRAVAISRGDWSTHVEVQGTMTCDHDDFTLEHTLDAYEGANLVARRSWTTKIPRDHN
jgi:predicted acyl esterase